MTTTAALTELLATLPAGYIATSGTTTVTYSHDDTEVCYFTAGNLADAIQALDHDACDHIGLDIEIDCDWGRWTGDITTIRRTPFGKAETIVHIDLDEDVTDGLTDWQVEEAAA